PNREKDTLVWGLEANTCAWYRESVMNNLALPALCLLFLSSCGPNPEIATFPIRDGKLFRVAMMRGNRLDGAPTIFGPDVHLDAEKYRNPRNGGYVYRIHFLYVAISGGFLEIQPGRPLTLTIDGVETAFELVKKPSRYYGDLP